ncbi:MAG: hypothetical protein M3P33_02280 [bacterium]|nr:hypothetical protein [bacterium]
MIILIVLLLAPLLTLYSMKHLGKQKAAEEMQGSSNIVDSSYVYITLLDLSKFELILQDLLKYLESNSKHLFAIQIIFPDPYSVNIVLYVPLNWINSTQNRSEILEIDDIWQNVNHQEYYISDDPVLVSQIAQEWRIKHHSANLYKTEFNSIIKGDSGPYNAQMWADFKTKKVSFGAPSIDKSALLDSIKQL